MRRADRLFEIIQILRRVRRPVSAQAIADELEVSKRSVYRDIATLTAQRVPIRGEAGIGYVLEEGFDMPPLMLTAEEIDAAVRVLLPQVQREVHPTPPHRHSGRVEQVRLRAQGGDGPDQRGGFRERSQRRRGHRRSPRGRWRLRLRSRILRLRRLLSESTRHG